MKHPHPWFRASKNAWYVEHLGKQVRLGAHPDGYPPPKKSAAKRSGNGWSPPAEILAAFRKLMAADPATLPAAGPVSTALLCDLFLDFSQKNHSADTFANYRHFLESFCRRVGNSPAVEVLPFHVTAWLDGNPGWNGGRRHAVIAVRRAYSWGHEQGLITLNPLRGLKAPRAKPRTRVLSAAELDEILAAIRDRQFREFMRAMLETGCRPSEVARVTAENARPDLGVWVLPEHKTAKKTHKPRVVYLTPAMVGLTQRLMAEHPEGPLFRGPRKKAAFTRQNIRCRFRRLRKKLPHLKHFVCYNVRHTFATQALVNGVGVAQVAELLGHSSTEMVSKNYGHLDEQVAHLREAARKAATRPAGA